MQGMGHAQTVPASAEPSMMETVLSRIVTGNSVTNEIAIELREIAERRLGPASLTQVNKHPSVVGQPYPSTPATTEESTASRINRALDDQLNVINELRTQLMRFKSL